MVVSTWKERERSSSDTTRILSLFRPRSAKLGSQWDVVRMVVVGGGRRAFSTILAVSDVVALAAAPPAAAARSDKCLG
jgi:hypothetical protein